MKSNIPYFLLIRLNSNGSRDESFPAAAGNGVVTSFVLQPDAKILVGSSYGYDLGWVARFNSNGSVDNTFNGGSANGSINSVVLQSNGKIFIAGAFTSFDGTNCSHIARLNANGTVDANFNGSARPGVVTAAALQPDGNILISGGLITTEGAMRTGVARLIANDLLMILRGNASVILSWPISTVDFQLQEVSNLSFSKEWSAVVGAHSTNNGVVSVTLPLSGNQKFFRLSSP